MTFYSFKYNLVGEYSRIVNDEHVSNFDDLLKLNNYDDIQSINCSLYNNTLDKYKYTKLPGRLPTRLKYLDCSNNLLEELPLLPDGLIVLKCYNNRLKCLPDKLPITIKEINVQNNNIECLPICLLDRIHISNLSATNNTGYWSCCNEINFNGKTHKCYNGHGVNLYKRLIIVGNPVCDKIKKFHGRNTFNQRTLKYLKHILMYKPCVKKIENWFLECKYNPKYKYCRDRLNKEFSELYSED